MVIGKLKLFFFKPNTYLPPQERAHKHDPACEASAVVCQKVRLGLWDVPVPV